MALTLFIPSKKKEEPKAEGLKPKEEVLRYRQQIQNFRRFEELTRELLLIGERLCDQGRDEKKKTEEFSLETDREVARLIERIGREQSFDLEAVEAALRAAVFRGRGQAFRKPA